MKGIWKMTVRAIRTYLGRFLAILLIVALSAGFFAGLKITTSAMLATGETYLEDRNFYDFRLLSTIGFAKEDPEALGQLEGIEVAEGTYSLDALVRYEEQVSPYKLHALTEKTNLITLEAGRMPTAPNECVADVDKYTEEDIGKVFTIGEENEDTVTSQLSEREFTIVGLCNSPLYLGIDRGTASIGSGTVNTFLYIPAEAFTGEVYTEINLKLTETAEIYSEAYDELIDRYEKTVTDKAEQLVQDRYETLLAASSLTPALAQELGLEAPATYVLTRYENYGYASFENDTAIIGSVANIFPVFFISIAILVCVTTMSRMVDEERTQIGTLKAMGFGKGAIMSKYLLYAAIATVVGWAIGFFACTWALPRVFWLAYNEIYNFAPIDYLYSQTLAVLTLASSLLSILGATWLSCRQELREVPASLIRPRPGKEGKRVLLERIRPLWKRLSFLRKITVRNMLLYKRRMIMMLVGIGCCAGLLVTGFGVKDSMIDVGNIQYTDIQKYAIEAGYDQGSEALYDQIEAMEEVDSFLPVRMDYVDLKGEASMSSVHMLSYSEGESLQDYWGIHWEGEPVALPPRGQVLISPKIAEKLSLTTGDSFEIRDADMESGTVTVAAVFDNHIYDYVILSRETYEDLFGDWSDNTALVVTGNGEEAAKKLTDLEAITSVNQLSVMENNISSALDCLKYIIWLVIFFSGALAFIVTFNLTNINIAERRREIATVQVLGFYPRETERYVLSENLILSVIASFIGMPLGKVFHLTVMGMAKIDLVHFQNKITPKSYVLAFLLSILFAVLVNEFMKRQISKVHMVESLKAVE